MIALSNGDKLISLTEVLTRVREHVGKDKDVQNGYIDKYAWEIKLLAIALDESEDYIRGVLRPISLKVERGRGARGSEDEAA